MAQKRKMWYLDLALAPSGLARVIPTLPITFPKVNFTYNPNFSHLGVPHGLEEGPVALGPGPLCQGGFWFGFRLTLTMGTMFRGPLAMGFRFNGNKILNSKYKYNYTIQRFEFPATAATRIRYPSCQSQLYPFFPGSGTPWVKQNQA